MNQRTEFTARTPARKNKKNTHKHTHTRTHKHTYTKTRSQTHIHKNTYPQTQIKTRTDTQTHTNKYAHKWQTQNTHKHIQVSQDNCARIREGVSYVKVYRYNPKHLCPKWNGCGDNCQSKVWLSCGSTHCTCQLTILSISVLECGVIWRQFSSR